MFTGFMADMGVESAADSLHRLFRLSTIPLLEHKVVIEVNLKGGAVLQSPAVDTLNFDSA